MKKILIITLLFMACLGVEAQTNWQVKSGKITFKIRNIGINNSGDFGGFVGTLVFDPQNLEKSSLSASVESKTIDTGIGLRDNHLRKDEYFGTEKYPKISMKSLKIESKGGNNYAGTFQLTIKNVTKAINFPFTFVQNANTAQFKGSFTIDRRDYTVGKSHPTLSDNVAVTVEVNVTK
ncbi:MAG: YceI family protein [Verrucomicrobia bacterium]|nr:YceI family protein [Cytophagales bacterium]